MCHLPFVLTALSPMSLPRRVQMNFAGRDLSLRKVHKISLPAAGLNAACHCSARHQRLPDTCRHRIWSAASRVYSFAAALTEPEVLELEGFRVCEAIARHAQSPGQSTSFSNSIPELFQLVHSWWFGVSSCFVSSAINRDLFTAWVFFRRGCPKEAGRR